MNDLSKIRFAQLDFLRALAVFLVIGNHSSICPPELSLFLNQFTTIWYRGGWTGVDLFFVLSGFLISGLLFNEYQQKRDINIKRFLLRRGFKIYPAFWFLIIVAFFVSFLNGEAIYRGGFIREMLFIQNYSAGIWEHTWSLAVEEHFYIFLSFLFFVLLLTNKNTSKNSFQIIPALFVPIAVFCLAARTFSANLIPFSYGQFIEPTHLRVDSLFFGVFLSYLWNFRNLSQNQFLEKNKGVIAIFGVFCFAPAFIFELHSNLWLPTVGLSLLYLGAGCLLISLLKFNFSANTIFAKVASLGKYSYSIYLWNLPVHYWLSKFTDLANENWFLYVFLYWSGTLIFGIGTAKIVEYPVLKFRDKIVPSQITALKTT